MRGTIKELSLSDRTDNTKPGTVFGCGKMMCLLHLRNLIAREILEDAFL